MRKRIIAICAVALLFTQTPQPAQAGAFATEVTQLLNHAQLVMQYLRQAEQLAEAVKQTTDMLKNSRVLAGQVFGPIASDINALASIVQGGQALAYSLANLDTLFKARFPGYGYTGSGYFTQYRTWSQTSLDTTLGALRVAFAYPDDEDNERKWREHLVEQKEQQAKSTRIAELAPGAVESMYFNYRLKGGDAAIRPVRVFDDGKKTYIQISEAAKNREAPVLVVIGPDGKQDMVNYRVKGDMYIVDRLFDRAQLVLGSGKKARKVEIERERKG